MSRIHGNYIGKPGHNSELSQERINSEEDWHKVFKQQMEAAGWSLKHEVVRNDGPERADFLGYHSEINTSYTDGEWFGFELKYSDYDCSTKAAVAAKQIERKYLDGSWLSSGEDVAVWVVAPYVEESHTGDATEMSAARNRELEAAELLNKTGFGYLNSWHPTPYISIDRLSSKREAFPRFEQWVSTPALPAFEGVFDPWEHAHWFTYDAQKYADQCRVKHESTKVFDYDGDAMGAVFEKYRGGVADE